MALPPPPPTRFGHPWCNFCLSRHRKKHTIKNYLQTTKIIPIKYLKPTPKLLECVQTPPFFENVQKKAPKKPPIGVSIQLSFMTVILSHCCKKTPFASMHAKKVTEAVLFYVFSIVFPAFFLAFKHLLKKREQIRCV